MLMMNLLHLFDTLCFLLFVAPQKVSKACPQQFYNIVGGLDLDNPHVY